MAAAGSHTEEGKHAHPNYMAVFIALIILTAVEVGIAQAGLPHTAMVVALIALALIKAGLVAQYFMHLKYDAKFLSVIAYVPLIVAGILITMLSVEWAFQPHWLF
jgi:cytochrome c oxidase subunit 4